MNHKLIKASVAGAAALALAAGGTTFAAWTDTGSITDNETAAGHLKLNLDSTGKISNVGGRSIAPGENRTIDYFLTSADLDGVPSAELSMKLNNLKDLENGCGSSESEADVDPNCANPNNPGEFSKQAYFRIRHSDPEPASDISFTNGHCYPGDSSTNPIGTHNDSYNLRTLAHSGPVDLATLTKGQGICLRVDLGLPDSANNKVQSDSSTFDLRFNLEQILSP